MSPETTMREVESAVALARRIAATATTPASTPA